MAANSASTRAAQRVGDAEAPPPAPPSDDMPEKRLRKANKRLIDEVQAGSMSRFDPPQFHASPDGDKLPGVPAGSTTAAKI
jgi:hypothetical protein